MSKDIIWPAELVQKATRVQEDKTASFYSKPYLWLACEPVTAFDVTLQSKSGEIFGCHKKVLSAISPVFGTILKTDSTIKNIPLSKTSSSVLEIFQLCIYLHGSYDEVNRIMQERDTTWKVPRENMLLDISRFASKYDVPIVLKYIDQCIYTEQYLFRNAAIWNDITKFHPEFDKDIQKMEFDSLTFEEMQDFQPAFVLEVLQYFEDEFSSEIDAEFFAKLMQYTIKANHKALEEKFLTFCKSDFMKAVVKNQCKFCNNSKI